MCVRMTEERHDRICMGTKFAKVKASQKFKTEVAELQSQGSKALGDIRGPILGRKESGPAMGRKPERVAKGSWRRKMHDSEGCQRSK